MYLRLVTGGEADVALNFFNEFKNYQEPYYNDDIIVLGQLKNIESICSCTYIDSFKSTNFCASIPLESYNLLKQYLHEKNLHSIQNIIKHQLSVEVFDGPPRTKAQLDCRRGASIGETRKELNKEPILYGLLVDSEINRDLPDSSILHGEDGDGPGPKKKKKRDGTAKIGTSGLINLHLDDSNSPSIDRIPLPKLQASYLENRQALAKELAQLLKTSGANLSSRKVSTVLYTVCNAQTGESAMALRRGGVHSMTFDESASMMAAGFGSGRIRIWSLGAESLRQLMKPEQLSMLDKDDSWIRTKMFHDENDESNPSRDLQGHTDAVNSVSITADKQFTISGSSDGSIRLWSNQLWGGSLATWKDHMLPVWSVQWAPSYSHYFVTGGADSTARLYAIDHAPSALRIFHGHKSDVTAVCFHPNLNYVATGSADRTVRLFDVKTGRQVRLFCGHKGSVQSLAISPCGRYLASGGWCGSICLWDLGKGQQIGQMGGICFHNHSNASIPAIQNNAVNSNTLVTGPILSLDFVQSNTGLQLASGGIEGVVRMWNATTLQQLNVSHLASSSSSSAITPHNMSLYSGVSGEDITKSCLMDSYYTRKTSVIGLKFVHPYLLLAGGAYNQN